MAILLYVVGGNEYRAYLKKERFKYLPYLFIPKIKFSNLGALVKEGEELGKIVGINTHPVGGLNDSKREKLSTYLLNNIAPDYDRIYMEDFKDLEQDYLEYITTLTKLKLSSGNDIRIFNIPFIISGIYEGLKRSISSNDTMIISNDRDIHLRIILQLMNKISFFTCVGLDNSIREDVYNEIFTSTGVSIFQPIHINKVIKNYSTIINFSEDIEFDMERVRNQTVIIDFSKKKPFKILENSKKDVILIKDIRLKVEKFNEWIDELVTPELFEALGESNSIFSHIYTNDDFYRVNDYILKYKTKTCKI